MYYYLQKKKYTTYELAKLLDVDYSKIICRIKECQISLEFKLNDYLWEIPFDLVLKYFMPSSIIVQFLAKSTRVDINKLIDSYNTNPKYKEAILFFIDDVLNKNGIDSWNRLYYSRYKELEQ